MFRFDLLRQDDISALLTLVCEVTELPADKVVRRTHVLRRLLKLVGGRSAVAVEMASPEEGPFARPGSIINVDYSTDLEARYSELYLIHNDPADPSLPKFLAARGKMITMVRDLDDAEFYRSAHFDTVRRPFDMDHSLYCRLPLPDGQDVAVGIQRCPGDPLFSDRERALMHLLHMSAPQVYYAPKPRVPELDALAPRLKPVLRCLLQGDAEKQVATKLALSPHTVHCYAKHIYRALDVNSRAELLAKYARAM
jgi:DNA-binding CsgD family transcriptional regulator